MELFLDKLGRTVDFGVVQITPDAISNHKDTTPLIQEVVFGEKIYGVMEFLFNLKR